MKVSVVIATRNSGRTIERCLRSVRGQNFDNLEIVVVDNSSSDDTVALASELADIVVTAGPERSSQRNSGAFVSSGELLMFVDSDMVLEPGVVRDAVGGLDDLGATAVVIPERSFGDGFWARCKALEKQLALNDPAVEAARVFRREDFDAVRGYDESLVACEDWDLADRVTARTGGDPARTSALIWHDEGRLRLRTTFQKKRYYGKWVSQWLRTAPDHRRHRSMPGGIAQLLRQPITAAGLIAMKLVETLGFVLGIVDARRADRRTSTTARERTMTTGTTPVRFARVGDGLDGPDATSRSGVVAGAASAAAVAAAMVQSWFSAGAFVASGDNGPWMRNLHGVTRSWSDSLIGTGSSAYPSASLIESFLHDSFGAVGISDTLGQRLWYTIVLAGCAASVGFLAAAFTRRGAAVAAAGLVAVMAPFHITTLPNILPLMAISSLALILGIIARVGHGRALPAAVAAPAAVWMSPLAKNPPLLALVVGITLVAVVTATIRAADTRSAVRRFTAIAGWFGAASLFWVVPLLLHYALGTPGLTIVAETDVDAWSWTQRHSGPGNAVTLVASWVWGDPHILPATSTLAKAPWSYLRWGLPIAALLSVPLAVHRRAAAVIAAIGAVLVVLSVGVNAPFGVVNRFLLDQVPGFWLFRQPMSKFGIVLVVVYAVLVALGVDGLLRRGATWSPSRRLAGRSAAAVLALAMVAFAHPLYTGSVIPGQRGGSDELPPARVTVPESWYDAGRWLDDAPLPGSVMVLPLSEYYQRGTTWGYYGVDDLLWRITDRPSLYVLPGGYYEGAGSSPALMAALQDAVAVGDGVATTRLMDALGVSYLAVRTDYRSTAGRSFADGRQLVAAADSSAGLRPERAFEHVHLYSARTPAPPATGALLDVARGTSDERLADVIAASPPGTQIVDNDGAAGSAVAWRPDSGDAVRVFPNSAGDHLVSARPRSAPVWSAQLFQRDGVFGVEVSLASTIAVDDVHVTDAPTTELTATGRPVALLVGDRMVALGDQPVLFEADGGEPLQLLGDGATAAPIADLVIPGNCNNARGVSIGEAGISASSGPEGLTLHAASGSACVTVAAPDTPSPLGPPIWHVRAGFDRSSGAATRLCLWLPEVRKCAVGSAPGSADPSGTFDFIAAPGRDESAVGAQLVLYADHQDGVDTAPATTRWSDVSVAAIGPVGESALVPIVQTRGEIRALASGQTAFAANPALTADLLGPIGTEVSDCHDYDDVADNGLAATTLADEPGPAVELRATRHSACVNGEVAVPGGLRHVTVGFDHRSLGGRGGRWCLIGPDGTCVAGGPVPGSDDWTSFRADVEVPTADPFDRSTNGRYRLYLYADGAGPGVSPGDDTIIRYRSIAVRPTYPMVAVAQPVRPAIATSAVVDPRHAASTPSDTAIFRLDQSYADDWTIDGLPDGAKARHVRVDGWANAWIVEGLDGRSTIASFRYGPDLLASIAVWSVVPVLALAFLAIVVTTVGDRRRRSRAARATALHPLERTT